MSRNDTKVVVTAETAQAEAALSSLGRGVGNVSREFLNMSGIAGALSIGALGAFIKKGIDAADALNDLSEQTGTAVESLAGLKFAAEQNGASLESVAKAGAKLASEMAGNPELFAKMGVTAKDSTGAMVQLADVFKNMPDGVEKSALATKLFGDRLGGEMINFLNQGTKALAAYVEEGQKVYPATTEMSKSAAKFNDDLDKMTAQASGLGMVIGTDLIPAFVWVTVKVKEFMGGIKLLSVSFANTMMEIGLAIEYATSPSKWGKAGTKEFEDRLEAYRKVAEEEKIRIVSEIEQIGAAVPIKPPTTGATGSGKDLLGALGGTGKGKTGGKAEKATAPKLQDAMVLAYEKEQAKLFKMGEGMDVVSGEAAAYEERLAAAQTYHELANTDAASYAAMREQIEADHQAKLLDLGKQGVLSREQIDKLEATSKVKLYAGTMKNIIGAGAENSRALFNMNKVAALADAAVSLPQTVMDAYKHGTMLGGPILGAAFGGLAFTSQMVQLNAIKSAQFGGGGGGAAPSGGGTVSSVALPGQTANPGQVASTPTTAAAIQSAPRDINITLRGTDMYSAEQIRDYLIPAINDASGDGVNLKVSMA